MLSALKNLWKMIVKALTLGTQKGNSFLDSKKDPVLELDDNIKRLKESQKDMRHRFFEVEKERLTKEQSLETLEKEVEQLKSKIRDLMKDGKDEMAKHKARSAMQKEKSLKLNKQRIEQLTLRKDQIELRVAKVDTDIDILESKKQDLKTMISMRNDSKTTSGLGESEWQSIQEIMNDADKHIDEVTNEDTAYQETAKTFDDEPVEQDDSIDEYLKNL